jgi:holo-[acyl-carrier protein] synthase
METCGVGFDLVDVDSIAVAMKRDASCLEAWFTGEELIQLGERRTIAKVIAGRIAAKEAVAKAIGTGFVDDVAWQDIEIFARDTGAPLARLTGGAKTVADDLRAVDFLLSITHTDRTAGACAVALRHPAV